MLVFMDLTKNLRGLLKNNNKGFFEDKSLLVGGLKISGPIRYSLWA